MDEIIWLTQGPSIPIERGGTEGREEQVIYCWQNIEQEFSIPPTNFQFFRAPYIVHSQGLAKFYYTNNYNLIVKICVNSVELDLTTDSWFVIQRDNTFNNIN